MKKITKTLFTLLILTGLVFTLSFPTFAKEKDKKEDAEDLNAAIFASDDLGIDWQVEKELDLKYAERFKVSYYKDGYKLIRIANESRFLVVPEDKEIPEGLAEDIQILQLPLKDVYLAASATVSILADLDETACLKFTSFEKGKDWHKEEVQELMDSGDLIFVGKSTEPDFETLVAENCSLALENANILRSPETMEMLEKIDITVFIDESSYEEHPLGRSEWIYCYAAIFGKEELAEEIMEEQIAYTENLNLEVEEHPSVIFFHVNSKGEVVVRNGQDYLSTMLEMAGGDYLFKDIDRSISAKVNVPVEWENFYEKAKDVDILIFNASTHGDIENVAELIEMNPLFADMSAVQEGRVWCATKTFYQDIVAHGKFMAELNKIFTTPQETWSELETEYLFLVDAE